MEWHIIQVRFVICPATVVFQLLWNICWSFETLHQILEIFGIKILFRWFLVVPCTVNTIATAANYMLFYLFYSFVLKECILNHIDPFFESSKPIARHVSTRSYIFFFFLFLSFFSFFLSFFLSSFFLSFLQKELITFQVLKYIECNFECLSHMLFLYILKVSCMFWQL